MLRVSHPRSRQIGFEPPCVAMGVSPWLSCGVCLGERLPGCEICKTRDLVPAGVHVKSCRQSDSMSMSTMSTVCMTLSGLARAIHGKLLLLLFNIVCMSDLRFCPGGDSERVIAVLSTYSGTHPCFWPFPGF